MTDIVCSIYKVPLICGFNILSFVLATIGPLVLFRFTGYPIDFKTLLFAMVGITLYTYLLILYKCKQGRLKETFLSNIPWYVWGVAVIILGYISGFNPTLQLIQTLLNGPLGIILIGALIYLPLLGKITNCF